MANGEQDWEISLPDIELAYNLSIHMSTGCSPASFVLVREVELPHLSLFMKFNDPWEDMRVADEVRKSKQF